MPKNVKCKNCNNLNRNSWWCERVIDSPDPELLRDCQHFCERTNADRIRSMTDEELARWLDNFFWGAKKLNLFDILKWLKQPVEVE